MRRLVLLLSFFAVAPLLHPLYFWGAHDGRHSVYFLVEFDRAIQDGILWPRWAPDFTYGYGYPIFNIYAPLAYFLAEAFHLLGADFVTAVKLVFGLSVVLSGLAMYWFAREALGARGALLAAVVYVYVPYRFVDLYVRGALAESVAFVFLPLVLGAFRRLLTAVEVRTVYGLAGPAPAPRAVLAAFALAGLILTHTLALTMVPILVAYLAWHLLRIGRAMLPPGGSGSGRLLSASRVVVPAAAWSAFAGAAALGLSAVFWLPLALEYAAVRVDQWTTMDYDFRDHFVYPHQLVSPFWGYGLSRPGPDDDMPFQLGIAPLALALTGLIASRRPGVTADRSFFALLAGGSILLMLPVAAPLWQLLGLAALLQFPWRFLGFTALALAFLAGLVVADPPERGDHTADTRDRIGLGALLVVTVLASYPYLNPPMIEPPEGPVSLGALMRFQQSSGELVGLTRWNQLKPTTSPLKPLYEAGVPITSKVDESTLPPGATADTLRHTTVLDEVRVVSPEPFQLGFLTQHYPGWTATVNGQPVAITPQGSYGLITVPVPAGESLVMLRFVDTPPRTLGQLSSLLTLGGLLLIVVWSRWRTGHRRAHEKGAARQA
ncbi:MAG: hypothetical protein KatS3mg061_0919 [Dehalococcoidia bacterium]|nr:MAG: hypothetical protein KatS3mg061_0919 [Dehalococcoidia bacterium]